MGSQHEVILELLEFYDVRYTWARTKLVISI